MGIDIDPGTGKIIPKTFSPEEIDEIRAAGAALCVACGAAVLVGKTDPRLVICPSCGLDRIHTVDELMIMGRVQAVREA